MINLTKFEIENSNSISKNLSAISNNWRGSRSLFFFHLLFRRENKIKHLLIRQVFNATPGDKVVDHVAATRNFRLRFP